MKFIRAWLDCHVWPWKTIAQVKAELIQAKSERDEAVYNMSVCYKTYIDGYNTHWRNWIMFTNTLYSGELFNDDERNIMRRFYDQGLNSIDAIERLKEYRGIGRYANPFSKHN